MFTIDSYKTGRPDFIVSFLTTGTSFIGILYISHPPLISYSLMNTGEIIPLVLCTISAP